MPLEGKKILLIVSGGIAAYKTPQLVRDFIKKGAEVKVVMTPASQQFVSPLSLSTVSKNQVVSGFYNQDGEWNNHIDLALWADLILVAPCTANTLAKMVHGMCDNLAIAVYMSAKCPVFIAPAMDLDMYAHHSTKENLRLAETLGHTIIPAEYGELASGLVGQGRLADLQNIIKIVEEFSMPKPKTLQEKKVLITAGPTYEAIDPVRFIGNHSSGKMGFALAEETARRGAEVILISGPTNLAVQQSNIHLQKVVSAKEMYTAVLENFDDVDIAIASAAVADYTSKVIEKQKIKKQSEELVIELVKNPDILKTMGERKKNQFLVGFALETNDEEQNAKSKLEKKNLDMIVLNSLRDKGAGFQGDTNRVKIITNTEIKDFTLKSKSEVAKDILDFIEMKIK